MINLYWSNPSQLKCLVTLPYDLPLITIHISDWRHFSDSHNSQGSVAKCLRRGGICKEVFVANLSVSLFAKEVWKSVNIWGIYGQELSVLFFLTHGVYKRASVCVSVSLFPEWNKREQVKPIISKPSSELNDLFRCSVHGQSLRRWTLRMTYFNLTGSTRSDQIMWCARALRDDGQ